MVTALVKDVPVISSCVFAVVSVIVPVEMLPMVETVSVAEVPVLAVDVVSFSSALARIAAVVVSIAGELATVVSILDADVVSTGIVGSVVSFAAVVIVDATVVSILDIDVVSIEIVGSVVSLAAVVIADDATVSIAGVLAAIEVVSLAGLLAIVVRVAVSLARLSAIVASVSIVGKLFTVVSETGEFLVISSDSILGVFTTVVSIIA